MFNEITLIDYSRPLQARKEARKHVGPYRWHPTPPNAGRGFYQAPNGLQCDPRGSTFDLRLEEVSSTRRGATGYCADRFGDTILTPIVARLPHSRGFLAGWTMGAGMCASLDAHIWPDIEEAQRAAHNEAERAAEQSREDEYEADEAE